DNVVDDSKKDEYLEAIQRKTGRMNELITLLFDYVRLGSEGFKLNKEKIDICELVREVAASEYSDVEDDGMQMEVDIPEKVCFVEADKIQLSRVITNLITNARRHNAKGTDIGIFVVIDDDIRIFVADNGQAIPEEKVETLFDPFVMGDKSRNSKGGSGLGLSIVKKIVDMHGFRIRLVQKPEIRKYRVAENYSKTFMIMIPID
nr:HAMP domain-containing histidine kinase [Eubacterium sp.]